MPDYDLQLGTDGDLQPFNRHVTGMELVQQRIKVRVFTFLGEWFLDEAAGLDWQGFSQAKPFDANAVGILIRNEIVKTRGVVSVTSWSTTYDRTTRAFEFTAAVETEEGETVVVVEPFESDEGNASPFLVHFGRS